MDHVQTLNPAPESEAKDNLLPRAPLQTAVLFLVFNRPDTTAQVFEAIRKARPPRLYVAADGARADREGEINRVAKVRSIATAVDWPCKVFTLFRDKNLGCKKAVSAGISWFFQEEEQGIILEDDCHPHPDFFGFCESLLRRYAIDERVWVITGNNFQDELRRNDEAYYFSQYNHVWGWASWRRAWQKSDMDIKFWPEWKKSAAWASRWRDPVARRYWEKIFDKMYLAEIDTWDYPWTASVWYNGGLTVTPNVNLVSNIGFGPDSTHTKSANNPLAGMATSTIGTIKHPNAVKQDTVADAYVFEHVFGGKNQRFPRSVFRLPRKLTGLTFRFLKRTFG